MTFGEKLLKCHGNKCSPILFGISFKISVLKLSKHIVYNFKSCLSLMILKFSWPNNGNLNIQLYHQGSSYFQIAYDRFFYYYKYLYSHAITYIHNIQEFFQRLISNWIIVVLELCLNHFTTFWRKLPRKRTYIYTYYVHYWAF